MLMSQTERYLSAGEVARRLQVRRQTVTRWCSGGFVPGAWKTPGPRGSWRIPESVVESFLADSRPGMNRT